MTKMKKPVLELKEEILNTLQKSEGRFSSRVEKVRNKISESILNAKDQKDGLTQLYCCMIEANLNKFVGDQDEMLEMIRSLTDSDTQYILAKEQGVNYPNSTLLIDSDTYGLYYALNDHYSQLWDSEEYTLSKNGTQGNPLITNLIKTFYEDELGNRIYNIDEDGYVKKSKKYSQNPIRDELLKTFKKYNTKIFSDMSLAFIGGHSETYEEIVLVLAEQFSNDGFMHFAPYKGTPKLSLQTATQVVEQEELLVDYVVTANVLNAFQHHVRHNERDEVFAATAKILKENGKAIHIMEKVSEQGHFNINLNASMHKSIGQDMVYSFYREKTAMDLKTDIEIATNVKIHSLGKADDHPLKDFIKHIFLDKLAEDSARLAKSSLDGKGNDFRTSLMVMYQSTKPDITKQTVEDMNSKMNSYKHRFNYYNKPVYKEKPGQQL